MVQMLDAALSRRTMIKSAAAVIGFTVAGRAANAMRPMATPTAVERSGVRPELMRRALAALERHGERITHRDRIALADFTAPSSHPRLHVVDLVSGATTSFLVAHGRGSDPLHTGWLQRFSNAPGSDATSEGAFLVSDYYVGEHGRSQRVDGLDSTNNNALGRAIVIHGAWYAEADMIPEHGMLGRSEGCFAVGTSKIDEMFDRLGQGRMLFADKV
jgi:hypothetical protein